MFLIPGITLAAILIIIFVYRQVLLIQFRNKIANWRNNMVGPVAVKITIKRKNGKAGVEWRPCKIVHHFKGTTDYNVIFTHPKRWQGATSKTVSIKELYPTWAVNVKH